MKKIIVFALFALLAFTVFRLDIKEYQTEKVPETIYDSFQKLNRSMWFVGEWGTFFSAYDKVIIDDGVLEIPVNEVDRGPFLISKPIPIGDKGIIQIKRKALVHYGNNQFTGGFAVYETNSEDFIASVDENGRNNFGNGLVLVEYVHDEDSNRPGRDTFRVLAPDWEDNKNYVLAEPLFNQWFIEELIIDRFTGRIIYKVNGKEYTLKGRPITSDYIRIFMHSYGKYTGHFIKVDYIETTLTYTELLEEDY